MHRRPKKSVTWLLEPSHTTEIELVAQRRVCCDYSKMFTSNPHKRDGRGIRDTFNKVYLFFYRTESLRLNEVSDSDNTSSNLVGSARRQLACTCDFQIVGVLLEQSQVPGIRSILGGGVRDP